MKKMLISLVIFLVVSTRLVSSVYALSNKQSVAIQTLLDDALASSATPGISVSIIAENETTYFSAGYANAKQKLAASPDTLYELASVSKAFTGTGILLLAEQGRLAMDDPIQTYLPWLSLKYQEQPLEMKNLTLNHFLHHTSGLTNRDHLQHIPEGDSPAMLEKTVEILADTNVSYHPGERHEYGTVNYDVLGLVIEVVSGQSYGHFMEEQVFQPLGLHHTFVDKEVAVKTGQLAQGYRTSFLKMRPYAAPEYAGNKPAAYIISNAKDMAHWLNIQLGNWQDIPPVFKKVIEKSQQANKSAPAVNEMFYAAGWSVNSDESVLEHAGGNPNFSTQVIFWPRENVAISLLSNSNQTNIEMVYQIKDILDGQFQQSYQRSPMQLWDIFLTVATIVLGLVAAIIFLFSPRRVKSAAPKAFSQKSMIGLILTITLAMLGWLFPRFFGYNWPTLLVWQPYSLPAFLLSLVIFAAAQTFYHFIRKP